MDFLVVDDHPSMLEGIRAVIMSEFSAAVVRTARTPEEAIALASTRRFLVAVLDLELPGRDGPDLIAEIARLSPGIRILVYTAHSERQFGVRALRAGAHGYVMKGQPIEELLSAIRRLLAGKRHISDDLAEEMAEQLSGEQQKLPDSLSDRELQVLKLIARGYSGIKIGEQLHISNKTVSTYRSRLLEKLRLRSTADLIRYAVTKQLV